MAWTCIFSDLDCTITWSLLLMLQLGSAVTFRILERHANATSAPSDDLLQGYRVGRDFYNVVCNVLGPRQINLSFLRDICFICSKTRRQKRALICCIIPF
jgi:hypothetical protein